MRVGLIRVIRVNHDTGLHALQMCVCVCVCCVTHVCVCVSMCVRGSRVCLGHNILRVSQGIDPFSDTCEFVRRVPS